MRLIYHYHISFFDSKRDGKKLRIMDPIHHHKELLSQVDQRNPTHHKRVKDKLIWIDQQNFKGPTWGNSPTMPKKLFMQGRIRRVGKSPLDACWVASNLAFHDNLCHALSFVYYYEPILD